MLDFGTTGRLRHSDLVMYDRQTESWWQQATGEGIVGTYAGKRLRPIAAPVTSWRDFRDRFPTGRVLSRNTGHDRPYGRNPYERYDTRAGPIAAFFHRKPDGRLPAMERVVALEIEVRSVAYAFSRLGRQRVVDDQIGALPLVVVWVPGTASAVDAWAIRDGRDVGATAVFDRRIDDRVLTFEPADEGRFRDRETNSVWLPSGRAVAGPLAGRRLVPIPHGNHFRFAWAVFRPDTKLVR